MKMVKKCDKCGGYNIRRTGHNLGYTSAEDLGRPAGAKGRDEFIIVDVCADCGSVCISEVSEPCYICGGDPVEGINMSARNEIVTGIYEWVPGLPNTVNLCGAADCSKQLNERIIRAMDEAFGQGGE